ncbi:MAG: 4-demethylwyosine synthase TYW1 [Halobacteria archaeon]|nr:4-demethylwyosine synthase TYW1 [Halobacteria archaeon]
MRDNEKDAVGKNGDSNSDEVTQVGKPDYHMENHTACQTCGWTKNALKGEGKCYKYVFYGIESHRCVQMTPVVTCNERCVFCWRDHEGHAWEVDAKWDEPAEVVDASIDLQRKLLGGFKGNEQVPKERFDEAMEPRHVAISLDGEPTLYPYLPELIEEYHNRDITTFLVSNGTNPEMLADCEPTQMYVSVDAADEETFDDVVRAVDQDAWDSNMETLDVVADKDNTRTVIRTTLINGWNMGDNVSGAPEEFARLFERASPDFIELKSYMHVGHSRSRLDRDAMPDHSDVVEFTREVQEHLSGYDTFKQVPRSNVTLLAQDDDTWVEKLKKGSGFWEKDENENSDEKKATAKSG